MDMNEPNQCLLQMPLELKEELEALAKSKGVSIDVVIKELLEANQPKNHLAKSIVSKKKSTNIPSVIRHQFDIQPGDTIFWDLLDGEIVLKVNEPKRD